MCIRDIRVLCMIRRRHDRKLEQRTHVGAAEKIYTGHLPLSANSRLSFRPISGAQRTNTSVHDCSVWSPNFRFCLPLFITELPNCGDTNSQNSIYRQIWSIRLKIDFEITLLRFEQRLSRLHPLCAYRFHIESHIPDHENNIGFWFITRVIYAFSMAPPHFVCRRHWDA